MPSSANSPATFESATSHTQGLAARSSQAIFGFTKSAAAIRDCDAESGSPFFSSRRRRLRHLLHRLRPARRQETLHHRQPQHASHVRTKNPDALYVCRDAGAGGYQAFPDVCRLRDGRLMAVFLAGYGHISLPNAQWPKGGRISYCISSDKGHSWSKAETRIDTPYDDRDPSLAQLKDGRVLCTFFCLQKGTKPGQDYDFLGTWLIVSNDLGKTWFEPRILRRGRDVHQNQSRPVCSQPPVRNAPAIALQRDGRLSDHRRRTMPWRLRAPGSAPATPSGPTASDRCPMPSGAADLYLEQVLNLLASCHEAT